MKRGQVTIFILIGILIVSAVLIFFLWGRPIYINNNSASLGFESCVGDALQERILELEVNGGFIDPEFTYLHRGKEFVYLCYTSEFYETCIVQVPFLKNNFDRELESVIQNDVNICYENSLAALQEQGYEVISGNVDYNIEIEPGSVRIEIDAPTSVGSRGFGKFNSEVSSSLYDLLMLSTSILQFETRYGDTDLSSYEVLYPNYDINKLKMSDGTTIYSLEAKGTGDTFSFASRSLAWPAGYDL
jgi:hypothetical protein